MARFTDENVIPKPAPPVLENIPDELRELNQWVLWRFEWRDQGKGKGEWAKVPHSPVTGKYASTTDSATWGSFDDVAEKYSVQSDYYSGIGFVFSERDEYAGVDFDNVVDAKGAIPTEIAKWVTELDTYTEISPSGTGLHCIVKAYVGGGRKDSPRGIEVYDTSRYFTFTGTFWGDLFAINPRQWQVDKLLGSFAQPAARASKSSSGPAPKSQPTAAISELLSLAFAASNGAEIKRLYEGDTSGYAKDASAADMALCSYLAFYSGGDASVLDQLFRGSQLFRKKWDQRHASSGATYGEMTMTKAIAGCSEFYTPGYTKLKVGQGASSSSNQAQGQTSIPKVQPGPIFAAESLLERKFPESRFAVPGLIAEGVHFLAGRPKIGKSFLALAISIAVAGGTAVLGTIDIEDKGDVLYLALEDGPRRLQKRLRKLLIGKITPAGLYLATSWPTFEQGGYEALDDWLRDHTEARLVVVDTFKKIRPQEDYHKSTYAIDYEAVSPLSVLAQSARTAILLVHHVRKAEGIEDPFDMISGSTGLTGASDGMLLLRRSRSKNEGTLNVTGRDVEERELALTWDSDRAEWAVLGDLASVQTSRERQEIIDVLLKLDQAVQPKIVSDLMGRPYGTIKRLLWMMSQDGQLINNLGFYSVKIQ